ncbi:MAG: hypothetical protein IKV85_01875 [Ruminococcus sp.]|nr:hypothetical protein [Ruminococcus sp.]
MDKMVYLYELDSVIKTKTDMKNALEKMYNVLMRKTGDVIVVSLNQIADSKFFDFWIADDTMKEVLIELLHSHRIVLLRQEENFTAREYLLKKFKKSGFISSFFDPMKKHDKYSEIKDEVVKAIEICNTQDMLENVELSEDTKNSIKNYVKFIIELCSDDVRYVDEKESYTLPQVIDIAKIALQSKYADLSNMLEFFRSKDDCNNKELYDWPDRSSWITGIQIWIRNSIAFNEKCASSIMTDTQVNEINEKLKMMEKDLIKAISVCYAIKIEDSIKGISESITASDKDENDYFMCKFEEYKIMFEIPRDKDELRCKGLFTEEMSGKEMWSKKENWMQTVKVHDDRGRKNEKI